jgi:hypothetical protein
LEGEFIAEMVWHGVGAGLQFFNLVGGDHFGESGDFMEGELEVILLDQRPHDGGTFFGGYGNPGLRNACARGDDGFDECGFVAGAELGEVGAFDGQAGLGVVAGDTTNPGDDLFSVLDVWLFIAFGFGIADPDHDVLDGDVLNLILWPSFGLGGNEAVDVGPVPLHDGEGAGFALVIQGFEVFL